MFLSFLFADWSPELTDNHIVKLSTAITEIMELRKLAIMGLSLHASRVEIHIANRSDLQTATYDLLQEWRKTQRSPRIAFQNVYEALKRSEMNYLLYVFQDDSVSGESQVGDIGHPAKNIKQSGKLKTWINILYHIFPSCGGTFILLIEEQQEKFATYQY